MTQAQDNLVFTLNDNTSTPQSTTSDTEDWEKGLERLQQKRRHLAKQAQQPPAAQSNRLPSAALLYDTLVAEANPTPAPSATPTAEPRTVPLHTPAPVAETAAQPASTGTRPSALSGSRHRRLNLDEQKQAYQAYLQHWQQQHNLQTASSEAELNNPQILFQEDWLAAQNSLRVGRDEPVVEQATVLLGGAQPTVMPDQDVAEQIEAAAEAAAQPEYDAQAEPGTAALAAAEKVVLLNAYALPGNLQHKILCLSEQVLLERLAEKLRPHLADAVSGMVKTALQRQTALMVQNMQRAFLDEVPRLVNDVLAYNLTRALAAVKKEQL
ncbi:hypothetical protein A7Q01_04120 [Eikenella sp. NML96-A-049]|uniref:hypothetical protein n=1 Tax=unclassified Eikenella TaxID=2639367 RepID=UPI0007DE6870|nr:MULTISPECIES: hypothetical protein [unclassified Eikenella]OAM33395.1 hypothetical protein A7P97_08345 [Eikenella sp. NML070372]OAM40317.1 hypothetical protein A7Q01_04120 [Eikenella sp. NML96-A-049]VDG99242.1 Uncharacterised protein [Helicobacter pametensis]